MAGGLTYDPKTGNTYTGGGATPRQYAFGPTPNAPFGGAPTTGGAAPGPSAMGPQQPQYADPSSAYSFPTLEGADITKPGDVETAYREHGGQYFDPSRSGTFADTILAKYGEGGALPENPGLGTYYDDAERRAGNKLNTAAAARGSYGSSYALGGTADMLAGMEADRAKHEADYALQRDAAQRGWAGTLGGIANSADSTDVNRWNSGFNAAGASDAGRMGRQHTAFDESLAMGDRLAKIIGDANARGHDDWWHAFDAGQGLDTGTAAAGVSDATYNGQQSRQDRNDFFNTAGNGYKFGATVQNGMTPPVPPVPPTQPVYNYQPGTKTLYPSDTSPYTG